MAARTVTIQYVIRGANGAQIGPTTLSMDETRSVDDLRQAVKEKNGNALKDVDAPQLVVHAPNSQSIAGANPLSTIADVWIDRHRSDIWVITLSPVPSLSADQGQAMPATLQQRYELLTSRLCHSSAHDLSPLSFFSSNALSSMCALTAHHPVLVPPLQQVRAARLTKCRLPVGCNGGR
jgi:hypothetical protein